MQNKQSYLITSGILLFGILMIAVKKWRKPLEGKITSKFGYRIHPITKASTFHNGIDITAPIGTKIYAPYTGFIQTILTNSAGGLQMKVKHSNGFITGYAHLSDVVFPIGTKVRKGQIIAYSGNTGKVTGPHLHFTLTDSTGTKVDPEKFIFS